MKLEDRIKRSIAMRAGSVVLTFDFAAMASASQVSRVLAQLVQTGVLVRVSKGAYAKVRIPANVTADSGDRDRFHCAGCCALKL